MRIEHVTVADAGDAERYRAMREATHREMAEINDTLRAHPEFAAPTVDCDGADGRPTLRFNNPLAARIYGPRPALRSWRTDLVPSAKALTVLYDAEARTLPSGELIDAASRDYFLHGPDAIAIRARAAIMSSIAARCITPGTTARWASLACGAAIPVFQALDGDRSGEIDVKLVDFDDEALTHAAQLATLRGFREGADFHLLKRHLIRDLIATTALVDELGEASMDFVDMLGIFEYVPDEHLGLRSAAVFLQNAVRLVKPGGVLVAANMLDTHPLLDFNQRGIGWPKIYPRSRHQLLQIMSDAGISPRWVTMTIADDGIYAVLSIRKPQQWKETP